MSEILSKLKKSFELSFDTAKHNAQNLKEIAGDYSKVARLKFEVFQLENSRKKKIELLGETVFPYLSENNHNGLKKHETLQILLDDIKNTDNEIELTQRTIDEISEKDKIEAASQDKEELKQKIKDVESEIESRMHELKIVKDVINKS